jgi:hypothetical protein
MPEAYDQWLAPAVFRPFAVDFARRAARHAPRRVLEIAAGTGVLTRELVTVIPAAQVTATDLNAASQAPSPPPCARPCCHGRPAPGTSTGMARMFPVRGPLVSRSRLAT